MLFLQCSSSVPIRADMGRTGRYQTDAKKPLTWSGRTAQYPPDGSARFYTPAVGGSKPSVPTQRESAGQRASPSFCSVA